jgi:hypothetical protein
MIKNNTNFDHVTLERGSVPSASGKPTISTGTITRKVVTVKTKKIHISILRNRSIIYLDEVRGVQWKGIHLTRLDRFY